METNQIISSDKATVVIQINPQVAQNTVISDDGQITYHSRALTRFFKAEPKALGTVQIMIGVVVFLFGIVLTINDPHIYDPHISVISGIVYWGSFIYISAGSLSVAAQNKLHPCVVKASLGMNVFSAVTAGISILMFAGELSVPYQRCHNVPYYSENICMNETYNKGILGILLVFSILQLIISICISGFACNATCSKDSTVVNVAMN